MESLLLWNIALLVFLSTFPRLICGEGYPLHEQSFVVPLTDDNFEHETQATTGGTTGSWLVWFHSKRDKTPIAGEVPDPDFWSEHHFVLASVDATQHYRSRRRFNVTKLPAFRFIHKGKYYRLDQPDKNYVFNWHKLQFFCTEKYAEMDALDIPPPRTFMDDVHWAVERAKQDFGGVYLQSMMIFFGFFSFVAIVNQVFIQSPKKREQQKQKQN